MTALQIQIDQLAVHYGTTEALQGISINIPQGDFLAVVGPNGGGKSTLMKALLGLVNISQGRLTIHQQSATSEQQTGEQQTSEQQTGEQQTGEQQTGEQQKIAYVPQFSTVNQNFPLSVYEAVLQGRLKKGLACFKRYSQKDRAIAHEKIKLMGLEGLMERQINALSGGEFQRMLIARALCLEPEIICLDEPTASVDEGSKSQIVEALKVMNQKATVILITHDLSLVDSHVKHLVCLNHQVIYDGDPLPTHEIVSLLYGKSKMKPMPVQSLQAQMDASFEEKGQRILKVMK